MSLIYKRYPDRRHSLFPLYPLRFGVNVKQHLCTWPLGAPFHQIYYVEDGECFVTVSGEKQRYSKGTAMYIAKGLPIGYEPATPDFRAAFVAFDGTFADSLNKFYDIENFKQHQSNEIDALIHQGFELAKAHAEDDILLKHTFDLVITFFGKQNEQSVPTVLTDAEAFIKKNYFKDISVPDIASAVGVSASFLTKLFRDFDKITPVEYLRTVRLEHARQLLSQYPKMPINTIAQKCGFLDTAYFCKVFKSECGKTPKTFAKQYSIANYSAEYNESEIIHDDNRVIINENFSIAPNIVSQMTDVVSSAWVKNDGFTDDGVYHAHNITWKDGYITLSGRDVSTRYFFYVSDIILTPGKYMLSVDLRTPNLNETTAVRVGVFGKKYMLLNPGVTCVVSVSNNWKTHSAEFSVDSPTNFYLAFFGGPDNKYIHDFSIKNVVLEKVM